MQAMTTRERFQAVMNFQPFDRLPIVEWAMWWDKTIERWHGESLPADVTDRYDICRHFDLDLYLQGFLSMRGPNFPWAKEHGQPVIRTMDEYERVLEHLWGTNVVDRDQWAAWTEMQRRGKAVLWFSVEGFFWFPRVMLGIEPHLYAFYDQPELMHRMNADLADWMLRVFDELFEIASPDFMSFAEDMSFNHGPMLSKELFDAFLAPYYRRVVPALRERGVIVIVDSDGDVTVPAGWFEDVGVQGILPLERQAGVDVAQLRQSHPEMRWIGCFDKMTMPQGQAAMRAEFERLLPTARKGGLIVSCDHQTPPGVSYDQYQDYLRLFRKYAALAGDGA